MSLSRHRLVPSGGIALLCAAAVTVLSGQQPAQGPPPSQPPPSPPARQQPRQPPFRSETNLVRVDVYATHDGSAVQDLTAADFELFEDGAAQKIDSFEHIVVRPALTEAEMKEPDSTRTSVQAAADPHRRVFVVYLDTEFSDVSDSHNIQEPLIDLLTRVLGPDDLVGVMTPTMSPSELTFGRRTQVIEEGLRKNWTWGRRNTILLDEQERKYDRCYPPLQSGESSPSQLAWALIHRRRERMVLESLSDLVQYMAAIREGRTAVITISNGWVLYRPDQTLTQLRTDPRGRREPVPGMPPPVGVGPGGTLTTRGTVAGDPYGSEQYECDKERMALAMLDDEQYFRQVFQDANRANVSFYPIDPRGLPAWDAPMGPEAPPPPTQDLANLNTRQDNLRVLATNTDGLALLNNNDLRKQIRRVADDLTSYYLIGYYSTNSKPDGKFRAIRVRTKRPGIDIRARSGYRAASREEIAAARKAPDAPRADTNTALTTALGQLELTSRGGARRLAAGSPAVLHRGPTTGNQMQPATAMVFSRTERIRLEIQSLDGGTWSGVLLDRTGKPLQVPVTAGERTDPATQQRWLTADLTLAPLGAGDYVVELTTTRGAEQQKTLIAIRVTQ